MCKLARQRLCEDMQLLCRKYVKGISTEREMEPFQLNGDAGFGANDIYWSCWKLEVLDFLMLEGMKS